MLDHRAAQAYLAIPALLAIAALFSEAPGQIAWRVVFGGVLPQIAIALLFLKIPPAIFILHGLDEAVAALPMAPPAPWRRTCAARWTASPSSPASTLW